MIGDSIKTTIRSRINQKGELIGKFFAAFTCTCDVSQKDQSQSVKLYWIIGLLTPDKRPPKKVCAKKKKSSTFKFQKIYGISKLCTRLLNLLK